MSRIIYSPDRGWPHYCEEHMPNKKLEVGTIVYCDCGKWRQVVETGIYDEDIGYVEYQRYIDLNFIERFWARVTGKVKMDDLDNPKAHRDFQPIINFSNRKTNHHRDPHPMTPDFIKDELAEDQDDA